MPLCQFRIETLRRDIPKSCIQALFRQIEPGSHALLARSEIDPGQGSKRRRPIVPMFCCRCCEFKPRIPFLFSTEITEPVIHPDPMPDWHASGQGFSIGALIPGTRDLARWV